MTETSFIPRERLARFSTAMPYWVSLLLLPLFVAVAFQGGWWLVLLPLSTWWLFALLDAVIGQNTENADPTTAEDELKWFQLLTLIWPPLQIAVVFAMIWYAPNAAHLSTGELFGLFACLGILSGTIGITYAHELMHQRTKLEKWMGDILMASVLYSHFRSEHILVHHRYVATRRDPVTARYNEGFWRYFPRVLLACPGSAWRAEANALARQKRPSSHRRNPFWRYFALQLVFLALAAAIGGPLGVALFATQAFAAIWQLELVNYIEHYGLTRRHLGEGRYEPVGPHHSWNATEKASNWLLINLLRHSDHHFKPNRRYPVLQSRADEDVPELPYGYPVMTLLATCPPAWRRVMNPKVRAWRLAHYPDISDWQPYRDGSLPQPI